MLKKLVSIVIVLGFVSSASALVIDGDVTWDSETTIEEQEGGGVEVTGTGSLTANARVNINSPGWLIIDSGGEVTFNGTFKFPDDDKGAPGPSITIASGGLMTVHDTESIAIRLYDGGVFLDACGTYVTGDILGGNPRYDPRSAEWKIYPIGDATGIEITVEGDVATVHGVPEPATIMLLGLGGLALLRRRK